MACLSTNILQQLQYTKVISYSPRARLDRNACTHAYMKLFSARGDDAALLNPTSSFVFTAKHIRCMHQKRNTKKRNATQRKQNGTYRAMRVRPTVSVRAPGSHRGARARHPPTPTAATATAVSTHRACTESHAHAHPARQITVSRAGCDARNKPQYFCEELPFQRYRHRRRAQLCVCLRFNLCL